MNETLKKNTCCSYCGTRFTEQVAWPRKCFRCYNDSFSNPLPVVVVLLVVQRAVSQGAGTVIQKGLLIQKRGIDPEKGGWALTGGYIDDGESWEEAAVREVHEELGLEITQESLKLIGAGSSTKKNNILIFCVSDGVYDWEGGDSPGLSEYFAKNSTIPNNEVEEVGVMWEPMTLAFPTHSEYANNYLKTLQAAP